MIDSDMDAKYPQAETAVGQMAAVMESRTTLGENIDRRIAQHRDAIARLERVRDTLRTGSILDVSMNDLQHAMRW